MRNAGAIFVGPHAPVSLGDYCAGTNHVLPTGGCACHSSGLSVRAFTKSVHVVDYSRDALLEVADHVVTLAEAEDLPGHGAAVRVRLDPMSTGLPAAAGRAASGWSRTAPRSWTSPCSSTSTRTPTDRRRLVVADIAAAVAGVASSLNRYPDREFVELRAALAAYLGHGHAHGVGPSRSGRPTAPTR